MTATSTRWHLMRRKRILAEHPEIGALPRHDPRALLPIILVPLAQFLLAYGSQYLGFGAIFALAWAVGSLCGFSMFNYSHELSHNLVHPKLRGHLREWLLHFASIVGLSPSTYILFSFGHKPHHALLGTSTVASARRFLTSKHPDVELLIDRYFFELSHSPDELPRGLNPTLFGNKILRMLSVGFLFPLTSTLKGSLLSHPVLLSKAIHCMFYKPEKHVSERLKAIVVHLSLQYAVCALLYFLAGPKALLYLLLTEVSQRGFLFHPIMIFPMTSHKTWNDDGRIQPTTSTYHWLADLILMKLNYHVEHHDFPETPCRYLPHINKLAPEFYRSLNYFGGWFDVLNHYYKADHWFYAGVIHDQKTASR